MNCNETEIFFAEWERMCQHFSCKDCPLEEVIKGVPCSFFAKRQPKEAMKVIQKWSDQHPFKTQQSEFLKLFPETTLVNDVVNICPMDIDKRIVCYTPKNCDDCRKNYWLSEVE